MSENISVNRIEDVSDAALAELAAADTPEMLEAWRIAYLGRRGRLTQMLRGVGALSPDERRSVGSAANRAKALLEQRLAERQTALKQATLDAAPDAIDVTLPGWPAPVGGLHPQRR